MSSTGLSAPSDLEISEVLIDYSTNRMTILGQGFDVPQDTTVTLGVMGELLVVSESSTTIEVALPVSLIDGNFLLTVETNGGSSGHDEFDLAIERPKSEVEYQVLTDDLIAVGVDERATISSFTVDQAGVATVLFTGEFGGGGDYVRAAIQVYPNEEDIPGGVRSFSGEPSVTASFHLTFPVSSGDVIRLELYGLTFDSANGIFMDFPMTTVLYHSAQ